MKLYGSLNNRLEENKMYCDEIKVGTGCTEYLYTDRHAYEVVKVIDQKHIFIRKMIAKRIDHNGMSECQDYEYISDEKNTPIELVLKNGVWMNVHTFRKDEMVELAKKCEICKTFEADYNHRLWMSRMTKKQIERFEQGKEIKRYSKFGNISFGVMEEYFDYSF